MSFLGDRARAALYGDNFGLDKIRKAPVPGPNTEWVGAYKVGAGSFGVVSTWVLVDKETSKPINQVVIKDSFLKKDVSTKDRGIYRTIYRNLVTKGLDFGADLNERPGHARPEVRFLKEAFLHGLMTEPDDSNEDFYTVPLWGYARKESNDFEHNHWRLYMPLYDCGDLTALVKAHKRKKRPIPEPFLWHTLECLMRAAVLLEEKVRERPGSTRSDVIVVFDMKMDNILLASPDQSKSFPIYPRPHIADLGGSALTNDIDLDNVYNNQEFQMTRGWIAPEMWRPSDSMSDPPSDLILPDTTLRGTWTNVWQIGRVLQQMMVLDPEPEDIRYHSYYSEREMEPVIHRDEDEGSFPEKNYSEPLRELTRRCLRFRPEERPTPQHVLYEISRSGPEHCQDMDYFGSDEWMEVTQGEVDANPKLYGVYPDLKEHEALLEKIQEARPYLRAWDIHKAGRFVDFAHFPPSDMLLERVEKFWWLTDPHGRMIDEDGKPYADVLYQWCPWEQKNVNIGHICPLAGDLAAEAFGGPPPPGPPPGPPPFVPGSHAVTPAPAAFVPGRHAFNTPAHPAYVPPVPGPNAFASPSLGVSAPGLPVRAPPAAQSFGMPLGFGSFDPLATPPLPPSSGSAVGGVEIGSGYYAPRAPGGLRVVNPDPPGVDGHDTAMGDL